MNYQEFINNIISTRGQWNIPEDEYYENHHIIPICMGGEPKRIAHSTKHENTIWLYPQEHYEAHKLLYIENPHDRDLALAWHRTSHNKGVSITAEEYAEIKIALAQNPMPEEQRKKMSEAKRNMSEEARKAWREKVSEAQTGKPRPHSDAWNENIKKAHENMSEEKKAERASKISASCKGRVPWNKGNVYSEEEKALLYDKRRESLSRSHMGKKHTEEWNRKHSETVLSKYANGEIVAPFKGKHHTDEARKKIGEAGKGNTNTKGKVWINNGEKNTMIEKGLPLPDGFTFGRLKKEVG